MKKLDATISFPINSEDKARLERIAETIYKTNISGLMREKALDELANKTLELRLLADALNIQLNNQ